jgi:hypothetical protein
MGSQMALELPEIVEAIVRHIPITLKECQESLAAGDIHAYLMSRATLRSVALVSRVFAGPAMNALWVVLMDAGPLIRLLKTYEQVSYTHVNVTRAKETKETTRAIYLVIVYCAAYARSSG